jgi:hypothetical protein
MQTYNLLDFLKDLPDPRRGQGLRHPLCSFMTMLILAILSGHHGIRGFVRFMKAHEDTFTELFQLKHGVPSFGTTYTLLKVVDQQAFVHHFMKWMRTYFSEGDDIWMAIDGKALRSTVKDSQNANQSFVTVVSAFAQHSGLVFGMEPFQSSKSHEAEHVRQLIEQMGLRGVTFTLDALHCQKKH